MKVWCVMEDDWEGAFLVSIWATEEAAKREEQILARNCGKYTKEPKYDVEEWEVGE